MFCTASVSRGAPVQHTTFRRLLCRLLILVAIIMDFIAKNELKRYFQKKMSLDARTVIFRYGLTFEHNFLHVTAVTSDRKEVLR